jgi:hypothetical protein
LCFGHVICGRKVVANRFREYGYIFIAGEW